MAGSAYIRFKAAAVIPGESLNEIFTGSAGWLEIGDWSWDIEAETSIAKGSGAALGKPTSGVLSWSHAYDLSSPAIMENIVKGTSFKTAEIVMLKQDGNGVAKVYFAMRMTDVFTTKVSSKGAEDGNVTQDVEMVFTSVGIGYLQQDKDNAIGNKPETMFGWNITSQKIDASLGKGLTSELKDGK